MSYDSLEQSTMGSQPIELYHVYDDCGSHWRYTSNAKEQTFAANTYTPEPIHRESIELNNNHFKNEVSLTLGRNNPFALNYISGILESKVILDIYRLQGADSILYWSGVVQQVTFDENEIPTIRSTPLTSEIVRVGARRRCQIMCDLPLYSSLCSVSKVLFTISGTITAVDGIELSSATFSTKANNWLKGGMIIIGDAKRLVHYHQGSNIKIGRHIPNLAVGTSFTAYAGCAHTSTVCASKFSNKINYGGCQFLPIANPFKNALIY